MSIVMTDVLRLIPLAVLFGIFLYMGVTSLTGIQLYERITLMVTPAKHHPDHIYVTKVTHTIRMFKYSHLLLLMVWWRNQTGSILYCWKTSLSTEMTNEDLGYWGFKDMPALTQIIRKLYNDRIICTGRGPPPEKKLSRGGKPSRSWHLTSLH